MDFVKKTMYSCIHEYDSDLLVHRQLWSRVPPTPVRPQQGLPGLPGMGGAGGTSTSVAVFLT